jgi:hypothetical protein
MFEKKKTMASYVTFFDGFTTKKGNGNYCHLFLWFYCEEGDRSNAIAFFCGGGVVKKVMATNYHRLFSFNLFILL